jgi:hypothetical protein
MVVGMAHYKDNSTWIVDDTTNRIVYIQQFTPSD